MTTATMTETGGRTRVPLSGLLWLTWRQHRWAILGVTAVAGVLVGFLLDYSTDINADWHTPSNSLLLDAVVPAASGLVGVFWGAPLLTTEYEQRTNLLVWTQDVRPVRWLLTKLGLLAIIAAVLWTVVTVAEQIMLRQDNVVHPPDMYSDINDFNTVGFESWLPIQLGYVLFGLVLGVAVGAVVRRTVVSVGITAAVFAGVRYLSAVVRPYYLPPVRCVSPKFFYCALTNDQDENLYIGGGMLDKAGNEITDFSPLRLCDHPDWNEQAYEACAHRQGVAATYEDFQPASRLPLFHFIELGIYAVLIAGLVLLSWRLLRRIPGR